MLSCLLLVCFVCLFAVDRNYPGVGGRESLSPSAEGLNLSTAGTGSAAEGTGPATESLGPAAEGRNPATEGPKPSVESLNPAVEGLAAATAVVRDSGAGNGPASGARDARMDATADQQVGPTGGEAASVGRGAGSGGRGAGSGEQRSRLYRLLNWPSSFSLRGSQSLSPVGGEANSQTGRSLFFGWCPARAKVRSCEGAGRFPRRAGCGAAATGDRSRAARVPRASAPASSGGVSPPEPIAGARTPRNSQPRTAAVRRGHMAIPRQDREGRARLSSARRRGVRTVQRRAEDRRALPLVTGFSA